MAPKIVKTEDEWRAQLDEESFRVTRHAGTERPFSGKYCEETADGVYQCICCGTPLFASESKFDAGCGWPSFSAPTTDSALHESVDDSLGMSRIEVRCRNCDAHLGHVFNDGPSESGGLRYCINSASLDLETTHNPSATPLSGDQPAEND